MSANLLRAALEARNPQALAELLAEHRDAATQASALLALFDDSTAGEVKRLHGWASDWLSEPGNQPLRNRHDLRWQAMNTVYALSRQALRQYGVTRTAEGMP